MSTEADLQGNVINETFDVKSKTLKSSKGHKQILLPQCNFDHVEKAFKTKSTKDILRSLVVLKLCSYDFLVDNSVKTMRLSQKILGKQLSSRLIKSTFYGQFVAGEDIQTVQTCVDRLTQSGIAAILAIPLEEDIGQKKEGDSDARYDKNADVMIECVNQTHAVCDHTKPLLMQVRLSALVKPELLVKLSKLIVASNYSYGNDKPLSIQSFARGLHQNKDSLLDVVIPELADDENVQLNKSLQRLDRIAQYSVDNKTKMLIDAEYTYLNPAMTLLTLAMMYKYNRTEPYIWNTYQNYLKAANTNLTRDVGMAQKLGFGFGVKLVRGAYIERERSRATEMGYEDPIQDSYEDTCLMYNQNLQMYLELIGRHGNRFNIIVASHNEDSISLAIQKMQELGIGQRDGTVVFGQLLGMCDQVSYVLGHAGYLLYKSLPVGTIDEVIPYLYRRATENRAVLHGARRERQLLWGELKRRMKIA
ncbi:hydroxyproline dehydrogenase-like [Glandiceps talaboti]